jgi:hypothetical protein
MEPKVNQEQIDRLYRFTREHFVEHYDLQTELVDHLSNAIEAQWQENQKLSFEEALQIEFKKFGVFGFSDVVEKRQNAIQKRYFKFVWTHFISFFKLPKIILTIGFIGILFQILHFFPYQEIVIYALILFFVIAFSKWQFQTNRLLKKHKKENRKRWLMEEIIYQFGLATAFPVMFQIFFHASKFVSSGLESWQSQLFFSVLFVLLTLFFYIMIKIIPSKAEEYLKQTYPEYAFVE